MKKTISKILILVLLFSIIEVKAINSFDIEDKLKTAEYSYLSEKVKDFIRKHYNETGELLLTEKNKENGKAYLNPDYIEYLDGKGISSTGYIPNVLKFNYNNKTIVATASSLPKKYDSRNVNGANYVTPLKEQYGELCWDFSITSAIESKLLRSGLKTNASSLNLAERMIDYVTTDPISVVDIERNPYFGKYTLNSLANNGNEMRYSIALVNGIFPIDESNWNYALDYLGKVKPEDIHNISKMNYQVNEVLFLDDTNYSTGFDEATNKLLKQHIMNHGSIVMSIRVGAGKNYVSYTPTGSESLLNSGVNVNYLYYKDKTASYSSNDHMVAVIGWDDDYTHNVCVLSGGELADAKNSNGTYSCGSGTLKKITGAWIIKNSSGSQYNYVAYATTNSTYAVVADVSTRDWDNVYSSSNTDSYTQIGTTYTFTKKSNQEKIKSIKLYSQSKLSNVSIYINTFDGSGEKLLTTFSSDYAGLYTIPVTSNNILSSNKFSVRASGASYFSVFTSNSNSNTVINIDDAELVNSFNYQSLLGSYKNVIVLNGTSRNVNGNINFTIKNSSGSDVTNLFNITRNYAVGNYINTLIRFNNNISLGTYTGYASVNGTQYATFKIKIDKYMENVSGEGTMDNPYIITNPAQLDMMRLNKYAFYKLGNDIDLTNATQNKNGLLYNDGLGWDPIDYGNCTSTSCPEGFTGGFDGNNHKIIGLYINRPNEDAVGLFRNTHNNNYSGLYFRNIIFENVNITGKNYVGALIGYAFGTTYERNLIFENISVSGKVKGNQYVGGIIGHFLGGTGLKDYIVRIISCQKRHCLNNLFNSADIEANNYAGGIVGLLSTQTYYNVSNANWRSTIDAYNWQNNGTITSANMASGLIGYALIQNGNQVTINNSINTGVTKGSKNAGIVYNVECKNSTTCALSLKNIYYTNDLGYNSSSLITATNVKKYGIVDLTNDNIYSSFTDFNTYYKKETINSIKRIPFLKNANVTYTSVSDINIGGSTVSIYDYVTGSKSISYNIKDTTIATIDSNGNITPKKSGNTTISVVSNYDGYSKEISLKVGSITSFTIKFNANGGSGTMSDVSSASGTKVTIPANSFTKSGYTFKEWNTNASGTGTSYASNSQITLTSNVTLYAIWTASGTTTSIKASDVPSSTYIIGKYMFTRNTSSTYDGSLTTKRIMLAARTLTSTKESDMIIYYKRPTGAWIDALTGASITPPTSFEIEVTDLNKTITITPQSMTTKSYSSSSVAASTYIIGKYMFTRNTSSIYDGSLTTKRIMLASKSLSGNKESDMIIYYKRATGTWIDALTGVTVTAPSTFAIGTLDLAAIN